MVILIEMILLSLRTIAWINTCEMFYFHLYFYTCNFYSVVLSEL